MCKCTCNLDFVLLNLAFYLFHQKASQSEIKLFLRKIPLNSSMLFEIFLTLQRGLRFIIFIFFCNSANLFIPPPIAPPSLVDPHSERRFRSKYHPDEASRLKAEAQRALCNRLNVFMFLMENGWFENVSLDIEQTPAIIKVLDAGEASEENLLNFYPETF